MDYPGIYQAIEFLYPSKDFLSFSVFLYLYLYFMYLSSFLHQTGKAGESVGRAGDELPGFPPFLTDTASPICISHFLYLFFNISGISQLLCPAIDISVFGVGTVTCLLSFTLPTGATPESCIFNLLATLFQFIFPPIYLFN